MHINVNPERGIEDEKIHEYESGGKNRKITKILALGEGKRLKITDLVYHNCQMGLFVFWLHFL